MILAGHRDHLLKRHVLPCLTLPTTSDKTPAQNKIIENFSERNPLGEDPLNAQVRGAGRM
jgi:hypothetical protein